MKVSERIGSRIARFAGLGAAIGAMFGLLPAVVAIVRLRWTVPLRDEEIPVVPIVGIYILAGAWAGFLTAIMYQWLNRKIVLAVLGVFTALPLAASVAVLLRGFPWTTAHSIVTLVLTLMGPFVAIGIRSEL